MGRIPDVFWFPLSLVTTPTLEVAVFAFSFLLTFALVSTTPVRFAALSLAGALLQPPHKLPIARTHNNPRVRFIIVPLVLTDLAIDLFAPVGFPILLEVF